MSLRRERDSFHPEVLEVSAAEKTVILSGAGFSAGLGVPLQNELVERVLDENIVRLYNFMNRCELDRRIGIEEFLTSWDFEEALSDKPLEFSSHAITSCIALEILDSVVSAKISEKKQDYILSNIQNLLDVAKAWITTNWDTIVETICFDNGIKLSHLGTGQGLPLLKLHGSVDWFKRNKNNEQYMALSDFKHIFGNYYRYNPFTILKWEQGIPNEIDNLYENCHPELIPPTHFKSFGDRFMREIWKKARHFMGSMDHLVMIGYSLPESDLAMRYLLSYALSRPEGVSVARPKVSVVDPDPTGALASRLAPLCTGMINFYRSKFENIMVEITN